MIDLYQVVEALRHFGRVRALTPGKSLHSNLNKLGFLSEVFVANNLISMYVEFPSLSDARKLFDELLHRNVITWTTMISAYTSNGCPHEAIDLYPQMMDTQSEEPNGFTYSAILRACGMVGDLELGRLIYENIAGTKLIWDTVLMNAVMDMYVKCGSLTDARRVFDKMVVMNKTSWNTIISGYCKTGQMKEAVNLFRRMPEPDNVSWNSIIAGFMYKENSGALDFLRMMHYKGLRLDHYALPCVLKVCSSLELLKIGKQIHSYLIKSGFESCCFTVSALLDMYSSCHELDEAVKLFLRSSSSKDSISRSVGLWNSMLSGYAINGDNISAVNVLKQLHRAGLGFNSYSFGSALKVCINLLDLRLGLQVHGLAVTSGYELDYVVGTILVEFYLEHGNVNNALGMFHKLQAKDIIVWSGLISGCVKKNLNYLAVSLLRNMISADVNLDQFVVSSVLKACSNLVALGSGQQIHAFSIKNGYDLEEIVLTSLLDMYSKCGAIDDGLTLFNCNCIRDVVCWTGIIVGCGQNGRVSDALRYFREMIKSGLMPNEVTFLGVLTACRHGALVDEAWAIFSSMKTVHGLNPLEEHYYCMVDILGQAGCFQEALKLVADMPFEPDQTIWNSLLMACGAHENTKLVKLIEANLDASSFKDRAVYATLANVYAKLGMWNRSNKVRETIRKLGMKESGKSWIETAI